ncbi:hypothetical protein [Paenibacillus sp. PL91]|uniref:hypothetical protein n=1 Tax=Paenibacillus sp. PL91 TaxID=2729538 RepID=UPI00145FB784|nr:hypothetical protein [Paenibacillus sp. PL91]MBC9198418.1 hypothetical protein [Paenibacillus sp. PL91]
MKRVAAKLNLVSFLIMLFCWAAFFAALSSSKNEFNPHFVILISAVLVFFLSVAGLGGVKNGRSASQSILAIFGSFALISLELWVVIVGGPLS